MKRPRRPKHLPDPLVSRAQAIPKRYRCRATNHHSKQNNDWAYLSRPPRIASETRPVPQAYIHRVVEGIRGGLRLFLVYEDYQGRVTRRHIVPKHWVVPGDRFTAHCELRREDRDFRVHRFLNCQFAPPESLAPAEQIS